MVNFFILSLWELEFSIDFEIFELLGFVFILILGFKFGDFGFILCFMFFVFFVCVFSDLFIIGFVFVFVFEEIFRIVFVVFGGFIELLDFFCVLFREFKFWIYVELFCDGWLLFFVGIFLGWIIFFFWILFRLVFCVLVFCISFFWLDFWSVLVSGDFLIGMVCDIILVIRRFICGDVGFFGIVVFIFMKFDII